MVMGTSIRTTVLTLAGCAIAVSASAQTPSSSLAEALSRSVCGRVQAPMAFSTRDTAFALSLPQNEPATIFLQVTVGKNGKVKEKLTRVDANHLAGYVAPAFIAATKDLRIDRSLLGNLSGKDTSFLLAFPLEYQCVYDTMNVISNWSLEERMAVPFHYLESNKGDILKPVTIKERDRQVEGNVMGKGNKAYTKRIKPTPVWYYLAFLKDQPE